MNQHCGVRIKRHPKGTSYLFKARLTQIILASACNGIRDVVRLRDIALRGISRRAFHRLTMLVPHFLPAILLPT